MKSIEEFINELPEVYQRIYSHPEYDTSSRLCKDREVYITNVVKNLQKKLGKTDLKVLDIGCAQGYFSLTLSKLGCKVRGVDFCEQNINLCNALSEESNLACSFEHVKVTKEFSEALDDDYDIVLLLSVIHHSCNESGFEYARSIVEALSKKSKILITELAVKAEPVYWNKNLPESYEEWFKNIAFFDELAFFETHLSGVKRPLIICSEKFFYYNGEFYEFKTWSKKAYALKPEDDARRYYISDDTLMKSYRGKTEIFWNEMQTEIDFIQKEDLDFSPKLIFSDKNEIRIMLGEKIIKGKLLLDAITDGDEIDFDSVFDNVLDNLIALERKGFYHGDLRSWNVCIREETAFLIDFGSIQKTVKDTVACAMNPKSDFTVYDAFIMLVYDCLIGSSYSSIKSSGNYGIRLFYDFDKIPKKYCNFIKAYVLSQKSEITYEKIKELFESYVKKAIEPDFTLDDKQVINYELLRRAFNESSSILEATENQRALDSKIELTNELIQNLSDNKLSDYQLGSNAIADIADGVAIENFYKAEDWGRWAIAPECSVTFKGNQIFKVGKHAKLCFEARAFNSPQIVKVSLNDFILSDLEISTSDESYEVKLPLEKISPLENKIAFIGSGDFASPKELGLSADERKLFIAFKKICIENPLFEEIESHSEHFADLNSKLVASDDLISSQQILISSLQRENDDLRKLIIFTKNHTLWGFCARCWHKIGKLFRRK